MKRGFHEREFDDATQVKLQIFRRYVREWISVMLTRSDNGLKCQHRAYGLLRTSEIF